MAFSVSYRLARVTTYYEDVEGHALINDYYGIVDRHVLLVKRENDPTLYRVRAIDLDDYSTDYNWFIIDGCRGLKPAKYIDNSRSQFVDQIFDQARRECNISKWDWDAIGEIEKEREKLRQKYS